MRYPASEKAEIISLVEGSHLPAKATLKKLGIPRATFYRWYDRFLTGGVEALADHRSRPDRIWNRIPDDVRDQIVALALEAPELSRARAYCSRSSGSPHQAATCKPSRMWRRTRMRAKAAVRSDTTSRMVRLASDGLGLSVGLGNCFTRFNRGRVRVTANGRPPPIVRSPAPTPLTKPVCPTGNCWERWRTTNFRCIILS
jgi:transposase-like protein